MWWARLTWLRAGVRRERGVMTTLENRPKRAPRLSTCRRRRREATSATAVLSRTSGAGREGAAGHGSPVVWVQHSGEQLASWGATTGPDRPPSWTPSDASAGGEELNGDSLRGHTLETCCWAGSRAARRGRRETDAAFRSTLHRPFVRGYDRPIEIIEPHEGDPDGMVGAAAIRL